MAMYPRCCVSPLGRAGNISMTDFQHAGIKINQR
jgi:hypothetical protein